MATNQKGHTSAERRSNQNSTGRKHANSGNFANMDETKHREISSKGGRSSHSSNSSSGH